MHEIFNASCRHGHVILMQTALYGRMRIGRCINGEFNIGCSKDVLPYFDSQCSTRQSCDVSIRTLIEILPCQRDFTSYLEASYKCIEVAGVGLPVCPRDGRVLVSGQHGYVSNVVGPYRTPIGSESCPWLLAVKTGQRLTLRLILLYTQSATPTARIDENVVCSATFVIRERGSDVKKYGVCAGKSRERHLYTSSGNEMVLYISREAGKDGFHAPDHPKFVISYEAVGCPDLNVPSNAWMKKVGDNVMIKCNDSMETWYFTCQRNQWIGDWGNCTQRVELLKNYEVREDVFTTHGVVVAVLIGIVLGIVIGMLLLLLVLCSRRQSKRRQKKRSAVLVSSRGKDYMNGLSHFRRGPRSRVERYPALLAGKDRTTDKAEKMYNFGAEYVGGQGCHPKVLTEYSTAPIGVGDSFCDTGRIMCTENGASENSMTYARIQPCPYCVRRQCQCLMELGKYANGDVIENAGTAEDVAVQHGRAGRRHPAAELNVADGTTTAKACVISLFQSDNEDHHQPLKLDLPDLHPLSSGCCNSSSTDPELFAALERDDDVSRDGDDDDDDNDVCRKTQQQQPQPQQQPELINPLLALSGIARKV